MTDFQDDARVLILLATYNGARWLDAQLRSILWQTHPHWRLLAQDDRSVDGTMALLNAYATLDGRIERPRAASERLGSAARNFFGLLLAANLEACDYVAFCDQDDVWAPEKIAEAIDALRRERAEAYSCDLVAFSNGVRTARYIAKGGRQKRGDHLFQGASAGCTYLLSREAATQVRTALAARPISATTALSHDWLIYSICRNRGLHWVHDSRSFVFYRQHGENAYGATQNLGGLRKKFDLIRQGWYRRSIVENTAYSNLDPWQREVTKRLTRFGFGDRCWLAVRAFEFRRRRSEALALGLMLLLGLT